jgi:hypothetical protein
MNEQEEAYVAARARYLEQAQALLSTHAAYMAAKKAYILSLANEVHEDPLTDGPDEWAIWRALSVMARDMGS